MSISWRKLQESLSPATRIEPPKEKGAVKPIGDSRFIEEVEKITGRRLKIRKPGFALAYFPAWL
jgi:hypothetical protein